MKTFITKNRIYKIIAILFWISVWHIFSRILNQEILLASPGSVFKTFMDLIFKPEFYISILNSFKNIVVGFFLAMIISCLIGVLSYKQNFFRILISPLIVIINTTPVVSFIILFLLFVKPKNLSLLISFLMTLPIIYTNVYEGLSNIDKNLLEMANVFKVKPFKQMKYIYITQVFPFFVSGIKVALGLCWKSGVAAEVISLPKNTIGEKLYTSKIYLNTSSLFAWTIVIILISFLFEKLFMLMLNKIMFKLERI